MEASEQLTGTAHEGVRFGRSRALGMLGAALFGFAGRAALKPGSALAYHKPVPPCKPSKGCHCCRGRTCCEPNCTTRNGECQHTNSTQNAWRVCHAGHQHWCADWWDKKHRRCICRSTYERACGEYPGTCQTGTDGDYLTIYGATPAGKAGPTVYASDSGVFFDCGAAVSDAIPKGETDLVAAAETIVFAWDNFLDTTTDPESPPGIGNPFVPGGVACDKYNLCIYADLVGA
jgi:hypothetical protein